jgi:hypothetical protein
MLKQAIVVGLVAIGAAAPLAAQVAIGVKGGLAFGNISNKGLLPGSLKTRTGIAGGIYLGTGHGLASLGVEGLYAQRGLQSDEALATAATKVDHLDVPVYLKLTLPIPGVRPFAYAGPQVSFEIKCREANGGVCPADANRAKTNYAAVIGGGVKIGRTLGLEGRYVYGLSDLKLATVTSGDSFKHRTFMLLLSLGL